MQQKLDTFDGTDEQCSEDYHTQWTCAGCGTTVNAVRRPAHLRACDKWGDSL